MERFTKRGRVILRENDAVAKRIGFMSVIMSVELGYCSAED
jgi:hypothetical protein